MIKCLRGIFINFTIYFYNIILFIYYFYYIYYFYVFLHHVSCEFESDLYFYFFYYFYYLNFWQSTYLLFITI